MAIARRAADLAHMLTSSGVLITLGGASTSAKVVAADEELLRDSGSPVGLIGKAIVVTVAKGALPGLVSNAEIVVTAGPLAGTYKADKILTESDGEVTRFTAYPTEAASAPDFWVRGSVLLAWGLRETGAAASSAFDLSGIAYPVLILEAEAPAEGIEPALNVRVQHCATAGGIFEDASAAFDEIGEDGGLRVLVLDMATVERYVRLVPVVTGTDTPAFWCGAVVLDVAVPR
jgi:hypothetical protein